jgi:hypothetical protein
MVWAQYFNQKFSEWRQEIKRHWFLIFLSLVLMIIAMVLNYVSGFYVTYRAEVVNVQDLILDHITPINLNFIFVYLYLLAIFVLVLYPLLYNVKKFHAAIAQFSFLSIVRSFFIILTHLQTPSDAVGGKFPGALNLLKFSNDQFFSGHVALPFLGFLLFYENKKLRYFFLITSIVMAITVLAMHQHYSIDVFAAFFITYGCYRAGNWLMKKLEL